MQVDLNDKVALVTGSARRVGRTIALELAKQGAHIMVHYRSADDSELRDTMHEIKSYGVDAFSVQADLNDSEGVPTIFNAIREHFGRLDILVNSASVFTKNTLMETTLEDWQLSLNVNLTAPFLCTQEATRLMQDNHPQGGTIINICDHGALRPWPERFDHGISKAGLFMLTKTSAASLGQYNIRVNGVLPGPVMQPDDMTDDSWNRVVAKSPLRRAGEGEDVARAVCYLASEDYVTGTIIEVNGGEHLS